MSETRSSSAGRVLVGLAAMVVVCFGLRAASGIVAPLLLALALTIVVHPLRTRVGRRLPTWLVSLLMLVGVYLLVGVLGLMVLVSVTQFADLVPEYQAELQARVASTVDWLGSLGVSTAQIERITGSFDIGRIADLVGSLLSGLAGVLSSFFFIATLLLFLAFDGAQTHGLLEHTRRYRPHAADAMISFARGTRSYLSVSAVFGLIVAVIDTIALAALGVPGAFVWGVLAFVTNFIPNIGFVIGVVPPALIALLDGGFGLMLAVIVVYSVINVVIQSIIQPRYVGDAVGLSTTLTFLSLVFWTWVLGPLGALLAVPMSLLVRAILVEANPQNAWMMPLISGRTEPDPGG